MVDFIDKSLLLIDQSTYTNFNALNHIILLHIKEIRANGGTINIDLFTRNIGRTNVAEIQRLTRNIMEAVRNYLNQTYSINVENVS